MDRSERLRRRRQRRYNATDKRKAARERYEKSETGRETRGKYADTEARVESRRRYDDSARRDDTRHANRLSRYLGRKVIALDGEGITTDTGHRYVYLAASDGSSLTDLNGLRTVDAFGFLLDLAERHPGAVFVSYGFGYDANKILRDLPVDKVTRLRRDEYALAGKWRIWWRPGRHFGIGDGTRSVTIWDLRAYFRGPFVDACDTFLGRVPDIIHAGKASRHTFTAADLPAIRDYNAAELDLTVEIAEQLRHRLAAVDITPPRMDGAGSIASQLMERHRVLDDLPATPDHITDLAAYAFIGGRVECIQYGHSNRGGWQYDMRAAYPWALSQLPSFHGTWVEQAGDAGVHPWALYQVAWWDWCFATMPGPIPYRTASGAITYPVQGRALIWAPEMEALRACEGLLKYKVERSWVFTPHDEQARPWAWVADVYAQRRQLETAGDTAASVLKLGMAAMWGKLAQRVGWDEATGRLPKYHHLAAAGLVTSMVRAAMWDMARADLDAVVAFETDALVMRRRITVPAFRDRIGDAMGQWKETRLERLTYAGPGLAFADTADGKHIARTAGIPAGIITAEQVLDAMRAGHPVLNITRPAFIGAVQCDTSGRWDQWGEWVEIADAVKLRPTGKRIPYPKLGANRSGWSPTVCPVIPEEHSRPYQLPWKMTPADLDEYLAAEYARTAGNDADLD